MAYSEVSTISISASSYFFPFVRCSTFIQFYVIFVTTNILFTHILNASLCSSQLHIQIQCSKYGYIWMLFDLISIFIALSLDIFVSTILNCLQNFPYEMFSQKRSFVVEFQEIDELRCKLYHTFFLQFEWQPSKCCPYAFFHCIEFTLWLFWLCSTRIYIPFCWITWNISTRWFVFRKIELKCSKWWKYKLICPRILPSLAISMRFNALTTQKSHEHDNTLL